MFKRDISNQIQQLFFSGKVLVLVGARQVGKTTLSEDVIESFEGTGKKVARFNGDDPDENSQLTNRNLDHLITLVDDADIIFIDEGQKITTIGQTLKLLVDHYKSDKQILVTGSSSFHLLNLTTEALTGRKRVFNLFSLSYREIHENDRLSLTKQLQNHLIYGTYPEVINASSNKEKQDALTELASSTLYRDILEFQLAKSSTILHNLLKALALQIGSEVSYSELSNLLGIDRITVEKYVDLLEKSYVIFRLPPYFNNKRKEISKSKKIYFYDIGIRNAIIRNFNDLETRNDVGALWENAMIVERMKQNHYTHQLPNTYFWRTYNQSEVDYLEEASGRLNAYEFKWSTKKQPRVPRGFATDYPDATFTAVTPENYLDNFIV